MLILYSVFFYLHILFGSAALVLFWIPLSVQKGSLDHVRFGHYYSRCMYLVSITAVFMALLVMIDPWQIHEPSYSNASDIQRHTGQFRAFSYFLLYLSLLTILSVRHGILVLQHKGNNQHLKTPLHQTMILLLLSGALPLFYLSYQFQQPLFAIFSVLGLGVATGMLRYCHNKQLKTNAWLSEHLGSIAGSGIGAYTAFFAFGGRHLLSDFPQYWHLLFWMIPGIIGSILISRLSRKYSA